MEEAKLDSINKSSAYLMAAAAIFLGALFDILFFEKEFGISVFIFEAAGVALTLWLCVRFKKPYRSILWLLGFILFFAAMDAIRDNILLSALNVLASAGLVLLASRELLKKQIVNFRIPDYFLTIALTPFKILKRFGQAVAFLLRPSQKSSSIVTKRVIIGIIMALPFLLFFGALFASADLAFKQLVDSIFRFQLPEELVGHLIFIIGTAAVALGLFSYLFNIPSEKESIETVDVSKQDKPVVDRAIEVKVFLWMIAGLFAIFLVFQVAYLFGGAINISNGAFTYADYARKGFFELFIVSLFTLLILLLMDKLTKQSGSRFAWFSLPSLVLIGEIFIIIISAFKRLMLYQSAYGLTTLRLYVAGFIIFLAVIFIILAIKLWQEKKDSFFAFGTLLCMIGFLTIFNLLNPDAFIAKVNIDRFNKTGKIDAQYLGTMSADATPAIMSVYERLSNEDKAIIKPLLLTKKERLEQIRDRWQSYNLSRQKALNKLRQL